MYPLVDILNESKREQNLVEESDKESFIDLDEYDAPSNIF